MKAHELAKVLLEGPDADVCYDDAEWGSTLSVEYVYVDIEGDVVLSYSKPSEPPTPEEIEERRLQKERAAIEQAEWEAHEQERRAAFQEEWGPLLP